MIRERRKKREAREEKKRETHLIIATSFQKSSSLNVKAASLKILIATAYNKINNQIKKRKGKRRERKKKKERENVIKYLILP